MVKKSYGAGNNLYIDQTVTTSSNFVFDITSDMETKDRNLDIVIGNIYSDDPARIDNNPFEHILYEFLMYLCSANKVANSQYDINLITDSHMVHMRNLAYYFKTNKEKQYLHYSDFIKCCLEDTIDKKAYKRIQEITSNSTCHLLEGRYTGNYKEAAFQLRQEYLPKFSKLIEYFILKANACLRDEYIEQWKDEWIQERARYTLKISRENYNLYMDNRSMSRM